MLGTAVYPGLMLVAGLVYAGYALALVWRAHALVREREGDRGAAPEEHLGADELAFLVGGERRVAETAIVGTVIAGRAAVDWNGALSAVRVPTDSFPEGLVADVLDREGPLRFAPLVRRLEADRVALLARVAVTERGLFLGEETVVRALKRRRSVLRVGWIGMAVAGLLAVLLLIAGAMAGAAAPGEAPWWAGPAGGMAVLFFAVGAVLLADRVAGPGRLAPVTAAGTAAVAAAADALEAGEDGDASGSGAEADVSTLPPAQVVRLVALLGLVDAAARGAHPPMPAPLVRLARETEAVGPASWSSDLVETALGDGGGPWLDGAPR